MALNFEDKKEIVAEVSEVAKNAISLVVADYSGLSAPALTALRHQARERGIYIRVIRNTLARRAFKDTDLECMDSVLVGPLLYGFSKDEPGAAARLFKEIVKKHEKFEVKALAVAGQFYDASHLDSVASLPSRHEALSMLAGVFLAPVTKLVRTINEPATMLVRALDDYSKKGNS